MGRLKSELHRLWGEPDVKGGGDLADCWHLDNVKSILVYYDTNGITETIKVSDGYQ